jgi:sensor c-di-GMP phosphodiesterase-like protein
MQRTRIIAGAILLALTATALPLTAMFYLSKRRAVETEQRHLTDYGNWTIMRADITLREASQALHDIEAAGFHDCSPAHINAMRLAAIDSRAFNEMGFYIGDHLACTSWGPADHFVARRPPQFVTPEGLAVHLHVHPRISHGQQMLGFEYGSHNVLVDPIRMVDVLVDNNMSLALANDHGDVLATLNNPDPALVRQAIQHPGPGATDRFLYSSYKAPGWIAVAIEHRTYTDADFHHQRAVLLPLGILIATLMVGGILLALRRRLSPLAELEIAVKRREFIAHYQPIVELDSGRCVGAEALVRWRRPGGQLIPPNFFIPLAEQSGLICDITDQVVERVLHDLRDLLQTDPSVHISINLCAADIESGRPLPFIKDQLRASNIPAPSIWLEATESGFLHIDAARGMLTQARAQGHSISIDDFGTGYSNLGSLHSLPLDTLKIDKSFIDAIGTESATSTVTAYIIDMAAELELEVVAEGIETEAQATYLRERNVRYGQGWLFAKAMPREDFLRYYTTNN